MSEPPPDFSEPAAAGAEPPAPEPAAAGANLEEITRLWPAVLEQLPGALPATLEGVRPVGLDAESAVLTLGFPADKTFNKRKAEDPERREVISGALETVVGKRLRPVFVLLDGEEAEGEGAPEAEQEAHEADLLERLKTEFDAEEVGEI
jgi:hypothetical protein